MTREDIHKPSSIIPADYEFVGFKYVGPRNVGMYRQELLNVILRHMEKTEGKNSSHEHGGTCQVCGANAHYLGVFYHKKTNEYVSLGHECTEKLEFCKGQSFNNFKKSVKEKADREFRKKGAIEYLTEKNLMRCWEIHETYEGSEFFQERVINDVVYKLLRWGSISERQTEFLRDLLNQIDSRAEKKKQQEERSAAASPCPEGRVQVTGIIISKKDKLTDYGLTTKIIVEDKSGFRIYGTVPKELTSILYSDGDALVTREVDRGDEIQFVARIKPSEDDEKFGFFSRPTKAVFIKGKTE